MPAHGANLLSASSNLRRRTLTALVLGPLVIGAVLWLPTPAFAVFFALVVLISAWEWCGLAGISGIPSRAAYLAFMAIGLAALWWLPQWQVPLLVASVLWWIFQSVRILRLRRVDPVSGARPLLLAIGFLVLAGPWVALISLHRIDPIGPSLVFSLLILIWTADSLAYFVGRRWGRAKLAPAVSPGKTRAGVHGAMVGAGLCALLFAWFLALDPFHALMVLAVCASTALISVVGDLYESLLKRRRGLKDSSQFLPGHGGFLDRIDSLTAAAPLYALGMTWALT